MKNIIRLFSFFKPKKFGRTEKLVILPPSKDEFDIINKYEKISVERTNEIFRKQGRK